MSCSLPQTLAVLEQGVADRLHVGAQFYVSQRDQVLADAAVGHTALNGEGEPLTPEHLTVWLSAGKPITAVAVAQQYEQGRLRLDDLVASHIPEFDQHNKAGITVRHLLTHTAPLRTARFNFPDDDWDTIIASICAARPEPRWTPGEKAGYSPHSHWYLLAEIVRRLAGERYSVAVRQNVLEPAGMADSWIGMPSMAYYKYGSRIARMPDTGIDETKRENLPYHAMPWCVNCRPSANACGPARELGRFYELLLHGGQHATPASPRLLEQATVDLFTSRHREDMFDQTFKQTVDWGLGFILNSYHHGGDDIPYQFGPHASPLTFGHGGSQSSIAFADPKHQLAVAIICLGRPGEDAHRQRMNEVLRTLYWELGLG